MVDHGDFTGLDDDDHPQYVLETLVNKKGDILVGPAADEVVRLGVGTNGYVLTADSTRTSGMKWAVYRTPSTASAQHADGPISQTFPALTQSAAGERGDIQGPISQTLPALTQVAVGESEGPEVPPVEPGHGGGVFLAPGFMNQRPVRAVINQTLPALTQSATGIVNDDELVLLLLV